MQAAAAPVEIRRRLPAEEAARADFHALLARLLQAPADASLLAQIAAAPAMEGPLRASWQGLVDASSVMDPEAAREEYEALFVGMGKALVSIYAGVDLGAPAADHPRVRIQKELADLGFARRDGATEPEDHIAGLFEMMRVLAGGAPGRDPAPLPRQRVFFDTYLARAALGFFEAVQAEPQANYYRKVAEFGAAFIAFEAQSFDLD